MSRSVTDPRLAFHATHYDPVSGLTKPFILRFFHGDSTVQIVAEDTGKPFLARTPAPSLHPGHFFRGSRVVVFGRVFALLRYADAVTENLCERLGEATVAVVAEPSLNALGTVLDIAVRECGFGICNMETLLLTPKDAAHPVLRGLPPRFRAGRIAVLQLIRDGGVTKGRTLPGRCTAPADVWVAESRDAAESAAALLELAPLRSAAEFGPATSVVLIKPEVLSAGRGGEVLELILGEARRRGGGAPLRVAAARQLTMSTAEADAYLEEYKGVLPAFRPTVEGLAAGALWAVQFAAAASGAAGCGAAAASGSSRSAAGDVDVVHAVREACGPFDSVVAKKLRPGTIRARLGVDAVRNVVHCTDLPDAGAAEADRIWERPLLAA